MIAEPFDCGTLLQSALTLVAMLAVLLQFGIWVPVVLAASTAPALWVVLRSVVRHHDWRMRTLGDERRAAYFDWLVTGDQSAAEVRLFSLGEHFAGRYRELRGRLRAARFGLSRRENLAGLLAAAASLAVTGAALAAVVWARWRGRCRSARWRCSTRRSRRASASRGRCSRPPARPSFRLYTSSAPGGPAGAGATLFTVFNARKYCHFGSADHTAGGRIRGSLPGRASQASHTRPASSRRI